MLASEVDETGPVSGFSGNCGCVKEPDLGCGITALGVASEIRI